MTTQANRRATIAVRCAASERSVWEAAIAALNASLTGSVILSIAWIDECEAAMRSEAEVVCLSLWPDLWRHGG